MISKIQNITESANVDLNHKGEACHSKSLKPTSRRPRNNDTYADKFFNKSFWTWVDDKVHVTYTLGYLSLSYQRLTTVERT